MLFYLTQKQQTKRAINMRIDPKTERESGRGRETDRNLALSHVLLVLIAVAVVGF